ncbi:39S ribosomal protein L12, mitochondrial-like [Macrosteles quadrilineatus]|uniref:39S ribosomal protein L12, mitochondrial-like n=1 Tax=Macrosteles quadrilineatus TaxID=74068 RepID=UPI0023E299C1|nr:39S ribosomal protein L12, mitochondrial-like [Macrosteles quadrilineatus]
MFVLRNLVRSDSSKIRSFSRCCVRAQTAAEPLSTPTPDGHPINITPKIEKLVADISQLTLVEVSELSTALKQRLNLPDAPMMAMGAMPVGAAQPQEDDEDAPTKAVKTDFTVKLMKYDEKQKVALIKEIKNLLEGMNLVQAKKFVESAPTVVKADVPKEEAEKLKEALVKVGAEITIE